MDFFNTIDATSNTIDNASSTINSIINIIQIGAVILFLLVFLALVIFQMSKSPNTQSGNNHISGTQNVTIQ